MSRPTTGGAHRGQRGTSRAEVLAALRDAPDALDVQAISRMLDLHANTVRFHLDHLVADELVERSVRTEGRRGRPRATYAALPTTDIDEDQRNYRLLAEILAGFVANTHADPSAASRDAGRAWGSYLAEEPPPHRETAAEDAVNQLTALLDDVGFAPRRSDGNQIRLEHCPFREVAADRPDVVCSVHLGLMQGALEKMRAPMRTGRLLPFVEPSLCIAEIEPEIEPG
ncbi:helix-turn-helix transcriptional regulator [Nocardioides terrisoli]|uniref:helix-turn-helix transcriptional regulator n=1 Tax=Nocardioides terrisoli TaxID=3388267 RepID=UPI00287B614A|nr:ArsR family transcriptional regulator [Nocardioides marmorisolisilvae]